MTMRLNKSQSSKVVILILLVINLDVYCDQKFFWQNQTYAHTIRNFPNDSDDQTDTIRKISTINACIIINLNINTIHRILLILILIVISND